MGKYPLSLAKILQGDELQIKVFMTLRLSRAVVGLIGGFALGISGFIYQTIFRNPLAAPDIIGVSSGASAGAAFGILFFSGALSVTLCSFGGALVSVGLAILFSSLDKTDRKSTVILAGIAVHSLAQTFLMILKTMADPEKQLASIEYWIMGSLNGINSHIIAGNLILCAACLAVLFLLHRQSLLLSQDEAEARMLGVDVSKMRFIILIVSTLVVSSVVSLTGLISFVGLLAPHSARKLTGNNSAKTMFLGGIVGGIILLAADILARSVAQTELPVSIFTSLIGAPFLVLLIFRRRDKI
ncbi:MAG: iron ABC transporter permease [Lachnospiraceae bacterium]|nr:iron ABC transporter permease [Lachnospiraceae bacterium]